MAISESYSSETISIFFTCLLIPLCYYLSRIWAVKKASLPITWPVIGMMPDLLLNAYHIHDYGTAILEETGGTFKFKGPLFCDMDMVITSDPANIHHVLSKNFLNYPKGPEFRKKFDILGNGIFNADSELWEVHRKVTLSLMKQGNFHHLLERATWQKVEDGLVPVLDHFAHQGAKIDLQDIFQRFTFDSISKLLLGHDPGSLAIDLPYVACEKAFNDTMEAILYRYMLPDSVWRWQKWLGVGKEKKLSGAWEAFDQFIYSAVKLNREKLKSSKNSEELGCITAFMEAHKEKNSDAFGDVQVFLRDTVLNLMLAGRDTTSTGLTWLFWLLVTNPSVETKVREEIESVLHMKKNIKYKFFTIEESRKLVYLQGAICEALRLFPPVALEQKSPVKSDILPSGMHIGANTKLILSFYSMGRMESIWGKDCLEFKPARWISESGKIKHEPSFKFPAFNAGPRTCLGKEMAFIQMKMVAATIISNYSIQVVEGHRVAPSDSVILQMKQGFPVKLSRRNYV